MRFRISLGVAALALAGVLAFAACGGGDGGGDDSGGNETPSATQDNGGSSETPAATDDGSSGSGSGDSIDACALVTQDEASAALGTGVGEGTREDTPPFYACSYETDGADQLTVSVLVYLSGSEAEAAYQMVLDINDYPTIDGLGDRAYDTRPIGDVTAQQGKYEISVDILTEDDEADFQVAKDLAKKALGRLP